MAIARKIFLPLGAIFVFALPASAGLALLLGTALSLTLGNPYTAHTRTWARRLLTIAVVGLGAGMNLVTVARVGLHGLVYTVTGLAFALSVGALLARLLRVERDTAVMISVGTAICGGSAIAAVAPVLRAKPQHVSVALGVVFLLNALALYVFPPLGHAAGLTETQFGLWSALAIHDTSSVVGAALQYGPTAVEVGTTVKLARALWIIPVTFGVSYLFARRDAAEDAQKPKRPWFILGFLLAAALATFVPDIAPFAELVSRAAKRLLVLTLFFIGSNLTREAVKAVGLRPFMQGVALWLCVAAGTLGAILAHLIA